MGAPATVRRAVGAEDLDLIRRSAQNYIRLRAEYMAQGR
jgi:carbonic anhydrase/acetyltransferase-like protein (isoleucine patch superfamily)